MKTVSCDEAISEIAECLAACCDGEWIAAVYTYVIAHPAYYVGDSFIEVDDDT